MKLSQRLHSLGLILLKSMEHSDYLVGLLRNEFCVLKLCGIPRVICDRGIIYVVKVDMNSWQLL